MRSAAVYSVGCGDALEDAEPADEGYVRRPDLAGTHRRGGCFNDGNERVRAVACVKQLEDDKPKKLHKTLRMKRAEDSSVAKGEGHAAKGSRERRLASDA